MRIADGRSAFVQWDTGQQIVFDAPCAEAHFAPRTGTVTIDVETRLEGGEYVADVPDELLQTARPVTVYAYVQDAAQYTRRIRSFEVRARPKPADYIYTPTERKTWEQLQAQIGDLGDLETEAKDNLVTAINEAARTGGGGGTGDHTKLKNRDAAEQHPMSAITGLTEALDGKQPTGDYLTADTLQAATDAALAQAKASGEFDGAKGDKGADGAGMDVTGATVGQIAKISAVDDNGVPTAWETIDGYTGQVTVEKIKNPDHVTDLVQYAAFKAAVPLVQQMNISGAKVGQTIKIKAADASGRPIAWEPVDMPSGASETWEKIAEVELTADTQIYELASFDTYRKIKVMMSRPAYVTGLNKNVWFEVCYAGSPAVRRFYGCGYMTAGYGYRSWSVTAEMNNMFITSRRIASNNPGVEVSYEAAEDFLIGDASTENLVMRLRFVDTSVIQSGDKVTVIGVRK